MLLGIVARSDIADVQDATTVQIDHLERLRNECFTSAVHRSHDLSQELVVDNLTVVIRVESLEDGLNLKAILRNTIAFEGLSELLAVEGARVIVVHDLKGLSKVEDATGTASLYTFTHTVDELGVGYKLLFPVFLLLHICPTLTLDVDALISSKVTRVLATSGSHLIMHLIAFASGLSALIRHTMSKHTIFGLAVKDLVVLILPLLTAILASHIAGLATTVLSLSDGDEVHVPDTNEEVLELDIPLERIVHELMILGELGAGDVLVTTEVVVRVVE